MHQWDFDKPCLDHVHLIVATIIQHLLCMFCLLMLYHGTWCVLVSSTLLVVSG